MNFNVNNKIIFFSLALMWAIFSCYAQQEVIIGTGTSTNSYIPTNTLYDYSYSQQIFLSSEINQTGTICSISFYKSSGSSLSRNLVVYLGHTTKNSFTSASDWISTATMTQVFSGTVAFNSNGWIDIDFDNDFNYNGTQNLVIAVDDNTGDYESTINYRTTSTTGSYMALYKYRDNTNISVTSPPSGTRLTKRNNIKLNFCSTVPMTTTPLSSCDLFYSDPGGESDYANNTDITQTISSSNALATSFSIAFTSFSLATGDLLYVYEGTTTSGALLGTYSGNTLPPTLTTTAAAMAFTLRFVSNASGVSSGWTANFTCTQCITVSSLVGSPCFSDPTNSSGFSASPFCEDENPYGITFPSGTGSNNAATFFDGDNSVGCLGSMPRPAWYYMQINDPGNLLLYIEQTTAAGTGIDVDFACWGPFTASDQNDFMNKLCCGEYTFYTASSSSHRPTNGNHTNDMGGYPLGTLIDCSYSGSSTEWCYIPNAQTGQFYILLLTNYNGSAANITFSSVSQYSTANTNCELLAQVTNDGPLCTGETLHLICNNSQAGATYAWTGPNGFTSSLQNPTIENVTTANAGIYSMVLTVASQSSDPATTEVVVNATPIVSVSSSSTTICGGENTQISASGASTYQWNNNLGTAATQTVTPSATTTYTVIGTTNNCMDTATIEIVVNVPPVVSISSSSTTICSGENTQISVSGASTYQWNNNLGTAATQTVTPSATTTYTVVGTTNNCMDTATIEVVVNATPIVSISSSSTTICGGENTQISASGASTYQWNNNLGTAATQTVTPSATTTYIVVGTTNNCMDTATIEITVAPDPSVVISLDNSPQCPTVGNIPVTSTITSGMQPFTYSWSGIGVVNVNDDATVVNVDTLICDLNQVISLSVEDANGCSSQDTAFYIIQDNEAPIILPIPDQTALSHGGIYQVPNLTNMVLNNVSDNCYTDSQLNITQSPIAGTNITTNTTITITVVDPCGNQSTTTVLLIIPLEVTLAIQTEILCYNEEGGSIISTVSGGNPPYSYQWSTIPEQITNIATQLSAGTYTVTVTDQSGSTGTANISISQPEELTLSSVNNPSTCGLTNGSLLLTVDGGVTPYSFVWSNGVNSSSNTNLEAGIYSVTVSDANDCELSFVDSIIDIQGPSLEIIEVIDETCNEENGVIEVAITGGTPDYDFQWSFIPNVNQARVEHLTSGNYSVTITDRDGCVLMADTTIGEFNFSAIIDEITPSVCERSDGSITLSVQGGTENPIFDWGNILDFEENYAFNLSGGNYSVTIQDSICEIIIPFTINAIPIPTACFEVSFDGNLLTNMNILFTNCSSNSSNWYWTFGDGGESRIENASHSYSEAGEYVVNMVASNDYDCVDSTFANITVNESVLIYIPNAFSPNGDGLNDLFMPICSFIDSQGYLLQIYNRWGNKVFSTEDVHQGWDGTVNGIPVATTTEFVFTLYYKDLTGKPFYTKGSFFLVR